MMDAALQRRIQRYGWDKASGLYERFWQQQLKPSQDQLLSMAQLKKGDEVLDVACGTGLVTFRAASAVGVSGSVLGTDISEKMISGSTNVAQKNRLSHVTFERMDAESLNIPDSSFDVALCSLGLMYVPEPLKSLKEMRRVLKPGGRAICSVWGQRDRCGWAEIFPIVDKRVASEVCPMFFQLGNKQTLEMNFEAAGFSAIHSERLRAVLHYDSADEACGAAFAGGPVALAYFKFDDAAKQEVHAEYLQSINPFKSNNGYDVPGEFVIACGTKH